MEQNYIKDPREIEEKSFEIISASLGAENRSGLKMDMIKRVIHTTADFEFARLIKFKDDAELRILDAFCHGCTIISDTNMIKVGINKKLTETLGIKTECFVDDPRVHKIARKKGLPVPWLGSIWQQGSRGERYLPLAMRPPLYIEL